MESLAEYLSSKGIKTWPAAGHEITAHCFLLCNGDKGKGKLYLNSETWLWDCKRCGSHGGRRALLEQFGDADDATYLPGANPATKLHLLAEYTTAAAELLSANDAMMLYLIRRGLNAQTILDARLGFVPKGYGICHSLPAEYSAADYKASGMLTQRGTEFHAGRIVIPYIQRDMVLQVRGKDPEGKYFTPAGDNVRLYNADALRGADNVVLTEGEFDALIVQQMLRRDPTRRYSTAAVVGLPGAGAWPGGKDGFADYFREAKRVFIALDPDETGVREANKIKDALGSKARIVVLPSDDSVRDRAGKPVKVDWTEYLRSTDPDHPWGGHGPGDIEDLLTTAEMTGKRIFSVGEAGTMWRADKVERPGIRTGFFSLDAIIAPGIKPGNLVVPLAKTGCIQADAEVVVNRAGKSFRMTMAQLVRRFNGGGGMGPRWRTDIPTRIQREEAGVVRLAEIAAAWCSGVKTTYEVTTHTGRTIRATDEHPFLTGDGWRRLDQLEVGTQVHVNVGKSGAGSAKSKHYYIRSGLIFHPHAGRRNVAAGGTSVPLHRLVAEATLNGIELPDLLTRCRLGGVEGLQFIDPKIYAVHHIDHDPHNNDPGNLKILTHVEHAALHAAEGTTRNVLDQIGLERVVSVVKHGRELTYDIEVKDDPHNFIVNGFVVHNTGKTVLLANILHNTRDRRVLHVTLENTATEVYELLHRIHRFWNPTADDFQVERELPYLRIVDENRLSYDDMTSLVEEYRAEVGEPPELISIDYLGYLAAGQRGNDRYSKTSSAVMELKAMAKASRAAIISPHQVSRGLKEGSSFEGDEARDSGVVEETADFLIGLYRPAEAVDRARLSNAGSVTHELNVQILKSRRGGKGRIAELAMSAASLVIADSTDRVALHRIQQENAAYNRGMKYDEIAADTRRVAMQRAQMALV